MWVGCRCVVRTHPCHSCWAPEKQNVPAAWRAVCAPTGAAASISESSRKRVQCTSDVSLCCVSEAFFHRASTPRYPAHMCVCVRPATTSPSCAVPSALSTPSQASFGSPHTCCWLSAHVLLAGKKRLVCLEGGGANEASLKLRTNHSAALN